MKKFRITKIILAKDLSDAVKRDKEAEIVQVDLQDESEAEQRTLGYGGK